MDRAPNNQDRLLLLFAVVILLAGPDLMGPFREHDLAECKSNLKNLATALEMYSTDHLGRFPPSLEQLTPNYLRAIPTCPAARNEVYSEGYEFGMAPDFYHLRCKGHNHPDVPPNLPEYDSRNCGFLERP